MSNLQVIDAEIVAHRPYQPAPAPDRKHAINALVWLALFSLTISFPILGLVALVAIAPTPTPTPNLPTTELPGEP